MNFNAVEYFFLVCAVVGGVFVVARIVMLFVGMDDGGQADLDIAGHDVGHHVSSSHSDSDAGFKALSLHGLSSFLLMFGLVGLALYRQSKMGLLIALAGGFAAGLGAVWLIGKMFSMITKLQSSGTIGIDSTVGAEGTVYLKIPPEGSGRVLVRVHNSLREYDAMSSDKKEITSGTPIRVVWVDGNVLVVEEI